MNGRALLAAMASAAVAMLAGVGGAAVAAEACRPTRVVDAGARLVFDRQQLDVMPRIDAQLARYLRVADPPSAVDLAKPGDERILDRPITLRPQLVPRAALRTDAIRLRFERGGEVGANVDFQDHRYRIAIAGDEGRAADGRALAVEPVTDQQRAATLAKGTRVVVMDDGSVRVDAGSWLTWQRGNDEALDMVLVRSARLDEISARASDAHVTIARPVRLLPGGIMKVQVTASDFDFRKQRLVFCFAAMPRGGTGPYAFTAPARLVSESADGATFETHVPPELARAVARTASTSPTPDSVLPVDWFGKPASVLVMGLDDKRVLFHAPQAFVVTNFWIAFFSGFALLVVLWLANFALTRVLNPFAAILRLAVHPTHARLSLSNVQVMLWTLLVLYAFCFVWVANGMLLDISSGVLVLLGISGGTTVLSRTADKYARDPGEAMLAEGPRLKDLIVDKNGQFDLLRFQMLGFTVFTLAYAFVSVIRSEGLPEIPENLYLLMGISSTAYLGGKVADNMAQTTAAGAAAVPAAAPANDFEKALSPSSLRALQAALKVPITGVLDEPTRAAVRGYKVSEALVPADGSLNAPLLDRMRGDGLVA